MSLAKSSLKRLLRGTSLPFGSRDDNAQPYTPREFVSGFIEPPRGVKPLEAAWHAAAVALETERVRLVQREADGGLYFLAANSGDFVSHPNAVTPLAAAIPGSPWHQGDGAYFSDLGSGLVAVVVKAPKSLKCYVGGRDEALLFAQGHAAHWPQEGAPWVGFRQYESRQARRLAHWAIVSGMALAAAFIAVTVLAAATAATLTHRKDAAIERVRAEQQRTAGQLGARPQDAYAEYRKLSGAVVTLGGRLIRFESAQGVSSWEAEFPSWVSDLSSLGAGFKARTENGRVLVSK